MVEVLLRHPEIVKAIATVVATSFVALFTIFLLIKLLEKVIMKGSYRRKAGDDIEEIKCYVKKMSGEADVDEDE